MPSRGTDTVGRLRPPGNSRRRAEPRGLQQVTVSLPGEGLHLAPFVALGPRGNLRGPKNPEGCEAPDRRAVNAQKLCRLPLRQE